MKKVILLTAILLLIVVTPCFADSSVSVGVSKNASLTYTYFFNNYFRLSSSIIIDDDDDTYNAGTSSDGNYSISKKEFNDMQLGIDLLWFPFSKYFYVGKGAYFIEKETITTNTPVDVTSGLNSDKDKEYEYHFKSPWSAGLQFNATSFIFGIEYHEMKDWNAVITFPLSEKSEE